MPVGIEQLAISNCANGSHCHLYQSHALSSFSMIKQALAEDIKSDCSLTVGLQWKVIYAGQQGIIKDKEK